jgi:hypothetical protein
MTAETAVQLGPTNNEAGAAWTAYILGELYIDWPRRRDFNWMDVGRTVDVSPRVEPEELFDELLMWLRDNGFVVFDQLVDGNAFNIALTEKGFAILGKTSIETERSLGSRMKDAATSAGKDAGRAIVASLVGAMVSGTLTALKG